MDKNKDKIRSFIAVKLPPEAIDCLAGIQSYIKARNVAPVRWVALQNLHLTLKFLGDITAEQVEPVADGLRRSTGGIPEINVGIHGIGAFPDSRRPQIIWAGLEGDIQLLIKLQQTIDGYLKPLGFTPEGRPFSPHLTLGRVRDSATHIERQALGDLINTTAITHRPAFTIHHIFLMKSVLTAAGPVYTELSVTSLGL